MLDNLNLFLVIVEKGGLAAAGRELGLSPATVSERLAALERYYGATLLSRTTRSISLTEEGRLLLEEGRHLLAQADGLRRRLRDGGDEMSGLLRISAPLDFGTSRLVPLLDRFMAQHPGIALDLNLTDGYLDLVGQGVDLALRYGDLADSTLRTLSLGENRRAVCASPDYLARRGVPTHPEELSAHDCLLMRFGEHPERWWSFQIGGALKRVMVQGRRISNNGHLVRQWCLRGEGVCLKSRWDVGQDLASGRLMEILPEFAAPASRLQIVYPSGRHQPRRVRALIDALVAEFGRPAQG
ncbi:LysR family transcriptional regulator [Aeromonas schubertii]|uniref:LysR family transcriptional regulator n=1 Tax=Aeromonas schubertii TaxID=652 RepID=A0A0S2SPI8_9GAMM|nr:LysR family transcriptional regulator [Aeromonas schubertii]ALP43633.1 LysR family transcriptional regulator [Aeromonas schubertii]